MDAFDPIALLQIPFGKVEFVRITRIKSPAKLRHGKGFMYHKSPIIAKVCLFLALISIRLIDRCGRACAPSLSLGISSHFCCDDAKEHCRTGFSQMHHDRGMGRNGDLIELVAKRHRRS